MMDELMKSYNSMIAEYTTEFIRPIQEQKILKYTYAASSLHHSA